MPSPSSPGAAFGEYVGRLKPDPSSLHGRLVAEGKHAAEEAARLAEEARLDREPAERAELMKQLDEGGDE
jgi:hypothetical protein